MNVFSYDSDHL